VPVTGAVCRANDR